MPYSLKGRSVLVTGGSRGLGAIICKKYAAEGANVAVNYNSSADRAKEVAAEVEKHGVKSIIIAADMCLDSGCKTAVEQTIKAFGGLDIVVHNAGWTKISEYHQLDALNEAEWDKCWAINTKAILHLTRAAMPTFNENPEGGVVLITSSIAGMGPVGSSQAYSVTKSAGLHLMQGLAVGQGPKLRINAICPGLLLTEWGNLFGEEKLKAIKSAAVLKKETDLEDTANAFIWVAKNSSMTGEKIRIDSGALIR